MGESFGQHVQLLSIQLVPFIMAVVFHEYAHGFVANRWGDATAKEQGRLTLNPLPHMDPIGTVLFPAINMLTGIPFLIGWAKPVPIDPRRFRKLRPGLFWVSLAGPGMNALLAFLSAAAFCAIRLWMPEDFYLYEPLLGMAFASVSLNYMLGIFNLLPVPPLDGSKVVEAFLSYNAMKKFESLSRYSYIALMLLFITGALSFLIVPVKFATTTTLYLMARLFHLPEVTGL
jgi:Zn-dependent protease